MSDSAHSATIRRLLEAARELPESLRHSRMLELGADPVQIAEVDSLLLADAPTSAWADGRARHTDATETGSAELRAGDSLGSWRLLEEIGTGGMGAVYLAERSDGHFDQRVAIKLIRGIPDSETFVHFARERQILAKLQHPNIARLLDGGATPGGQPYLVMEHIEGVPIERFCAGQDLDLRARLKLFQQVCEAVHFAHQRLVVHCDLKPSNVLVRADGMPVLLDFGIARALDQQPGRREEMSASAWVTPLYASPEQLRGEGVTTASDVFSLGLILFELLAGRRARVNAEDHTITLLGQAAVRPSDLAEAMPWRSRLRGDLDAIVQRATAADPAKRYDSAESLAQDLQRYLELRTVTARRATPGYRLSRLLRRRWPVFAAFGVVLALAVAFTWQLAIERNRALKAESEAITQARTAEQVSEFLVSVFDVSNPRSKQDRTISAREVLDQGAERIDAELADAPKVKARMMEVLGTAYRYIGESIRAAELLEQASALYLDPRVDQPMSAANALSSLAVVYSNNDYPVSKAEGAALEALRLREQFAEPDSLPVADALNSLAIVRQNQDRLDEAEALLLRSLAIRERLTGKESRQVAANLHNLARNEYLSGEDMDKSIAYFERALELKRRLGGELDPDFETTQSDLGKALRDSGKRERAYDVLSKNLALAREIHGEESEYVAGAHNEYAYLLHDMGRFKEAADEYRASIAIRTRLGNDDSASFAIPLNNLASALEDRGDYAAAEPLFRQSLELRRKGQDAGSLMIAHAEYNLARLLIKSDRLEEAGELDASALSIYRKHYDESNRNVIKVKLQEIHRLLDMKKSAEANALMEEVLASEASLGDAYLARQHSLSARIVLASGDIKMAVAESELALGAIRKAWGDHHPLMVAYALNHARLLAQDGQDTEARELVASVADLAESFAETAWERKELARWGF
ncbi:protein kinase domain-containing protein [Dokdonella sp.]|uniref:protein kinase domain-containing protein n=1 Tax=Dokdonella sp. TaxID=2291710 RepID=UPI003C5D87A9